MVAYESRPQCIAFFYTSTGPVLTPVLVHHAFGVEIGESRSFLHVRQHGRVTHPEPAVLSTSAPTVGEHLQERVLVDVVVTFAQSFGAVLSVGPKQ